MAVGLYMDVHIPRPITGGLRLRGVDVLTAQEDGTTTLDDNELLDRATQLNRLIYSQDTDLLREANKRLYTGVGFSSVIYSHQLYSPFGKCIADIEVIVKTLNPDDLKNLVEFVPW